MAPYAHSSESVEEYIDLVAIFRYLWFDGEKFLALIEGVVLCTLKHCENFAVTHEKEIRQDSVNRYPAVFPFRIYAAAERQSDR